MSKYKSLQVNETNPGSYHNEIILKNIDDLPKGDVLIRVHYSSLNYKDALSSSGNKQITKVYPHTPGIDASGIVEKSNCDDFNIGDYVIVTGFDLGMNTSGGFAEYIRVPKEWVVKLPQNLSLKESMIYGTAGFTAALCINKLINAGVANTDGDILVTGASGGVGSIAISILSKLGYSVIAATGKTDEKHRLIELGAKNVISRYDLDDKSNKLLSKGLYVGVIDTVGGNILATALKSTKYGGVVSCCGNVMSGELITSVYPFILRGITLCGVDSVNCPKSLRQTIWNNLSNSWKLDKLDFLSNEITLKDLDTEINKMLKGKMVGRTLINLQ
ncbi:MAG: YhdH/YhfP family quinone oxidoreductase [Clostridiaceae bacterium]